MTDFIDSYEKARAERKAVANETVRALAIAIQSTMKKSGLVSIVVEFDGSGDSGSVGSVQGEPAEVWNAELVVDGLASGNESNILAAAEQLTYEMLEAEHAGWEINEGACGNVTITADVVSMHYGQRVESVEYQDYNFDEETDGAPVDAR